MLTIFTTPKPFKGHIGTIQRNAITSWTLLRPKPEVILLGDEEGAAEICQQFGLRYIPEVERNPHGTPLINDLFEKAQRKATYKLMCYVNADIILMSDFMRAIERVSAWNNYFLAIGPRRDIDITEILDFSDCDWEQHLARLAMVYGEYRPLSADYFVFPRGFYENLPPLTIGRAGFDNWLIWKARRSHSPVVNISPVVLAIHQNHRFEQNNAEAYSDPESKRNKKTIGWWKQSFTPLDSTHQLVVEGIVRLIKRPFLSRVRCLIGALWAPIYKVLYRLGLRRSAIKRIFALNDD